MSRGQALFNYGKICKIQTEEQQSQKENTQELNQEYIDDK